MLVRRAARASRPAPRIPSAGGQRHDLAQLSIGRGLVRNRHRLDEMRLEARLDRGLDLLDAADEFLDRGAGGGIEERDARPGAGGVAGRGDGLQVAVGDEAEDHRVLHVDVAAEGAGEADAIHALDAEFIHEECDARVQGGLRELDRAHVGLRDLHRHGAAVQDIGKRAPVRDDAIASRRERAVDDAVLVDDAGQVHAGDDLDDPGAADTGDAGAGGRCGECRIVRPELAADHLVARLERRRDRCARARSRRARRAGRRRSARPRKRGPSGSSRRAGARGCRARSRHWCRRRRGA